MDTFTLLIIYIAGLTSSMLITWVFTKISLGAAAFPMTLYGTATVYFFLQPQINDYGLNPINFYLMGILFVLIFISNTLLLMHIRKKQKLETLMKQKKKEYRKERWE
jgi:hypothetical protein